MDLTITQMVDLIKADKSVIIKPKYLMLLMDYLFEYEPELEYRVDVKKGEYKFRKS